MLTIKISLTLLDSVLGFSGEGEFDIFIREKMSSFVTAEPVDGD